MAAKETESRPRRRGKMDEKEAGHQEERRHHRKDDKGFCGKVCQSKWCLILTFLAMAIGIAVSIPIVLLSPSVRDRFPPKMKWWQKTIVYQIYPRSFQDSDGDGVGDLKGITSRLDHFHRLNVSTLWLSPFYPSPMKDFGYDVSNFTDVDPVFGTLQDFDDLLKKAHGMGLHVILDFVAGHTSSEHSWFKQSVNGTEPYKDYYIWAESKTSANGTRAPPSNWVSVFGHSAWNWSEVRQQYYYHGFLPQQPTLNYRNPRVVEEMKNVLRFWLDRGVDGFRVDAVGHMMVYENLTQDQARSHTPGVEPWESTYYINNLTKNQPEIGSIVRGWREVLDSYKGEKDTESDKFLIVELYEPAQERNKYFDYGADMAFNFDLIAALDNRPQLARNACDLFCLRDVIKNEYDRLPKGQWTNFVLSNHDNPRAATRMGGDYADALNVLLLTLRGTPTTYYGEEIGMQDLLLPFNLTQDPSGLVYGPVNYTRYSRDPERTPMQWNDTFQADFSNSSFTWLPVNPNYVTVNVQAELTSKETTALKVYQNLTRLRQEEPSLQYGLLTFAQVTTNLLSFLRAAEDRPAFLILLNLGRATEKRDFSGSPVHRAEGRVKVATSRAANEGRFQKDKNVTLNSVELLPGDGLVVELG